jgi:hypothetical protein
MKCEYTHKFPVDEWNRPAGFYSLADVPVKRYKELTRPGVAVARDTAAELYEVRDAVGNFKVVVPFDAVRFGPTRKEELL